MGGSSSKQNVKAKEMKNYMKDETIQREAEEKGVDPALLAYSKQKKDKVQDNELMKQRTMQQKQEALVEQEQLLQNRINKANEDMEKAKKLREDLGGLQNQTQAPVKPATTEVTRSNTLNAPNYQVQAAAPPQYTNSPGQPMEPQVTPKQSAREGPPAVGADMQPPQINRNEQAVGAAVITPNNHQQSSDHKQPLSPKQAPPTIPSEPTEEERKIAELRRLQAEAKARHLQRQEEQEMEQRRRQVENQFNSGKKSQQTPMKLDKDSEEENDSDDSDDNFSRAPNSQSQGFGTNGGMQARVTTIQYQQQQPSPRNALAPDLGASLRLSASGVIGSSPYMGGGQKMGGMPQLQQNSKVSNAIMLGMVQETESAEDLEAQRNRNIDLADLQSLLA